MEPLVKGILINYRECREGELKWLRGWRKQRLRVLGWFGLKGSLGLDLLLPNERVLEKMKPEVHCKMTKDRCPVAAREIPAGYGGETEINRLLRYVVESPFLETFIYQLENLGNLFSL